MSSTLQISLDEEREIQFDKVKAGRTDLANIGNTKAANKLFFEKLDEELKQ